MAWASSTKCVVGASQHDVLHEQWHGFERRSAAREHLHRQQRQDHQQAELRHGARHRGHEDAHGGSGKQAQRHPGHEQRMLTLSMGTCSTPRTTKISDTPAATSTTSAHGPDLGEP